MKAPIGHRAEALVTCGASQAPANPRWLEGGTMGSAGVTFPALCLVVTCGSCVRCLLGSVLMIDPVSVAGAGRAPGEGRLPGIFSPPPGAAPGGLTICRGRDVWGRRDCLCSPRLPVPFPRPPTSEARSEALGLARGARSRPRSRHPRGGTACPSLISMNLGARESPDVPQPGRQAPPVRWLKTIVRSECFLNSRGLLSTLADPDLGGLGDFSVPSVKTEQLIF